MGCSTAKIRRCETGEREITDEIIQSMCESCSVDKRVFDDPDHIEAYCNYVPKVIDYRSIGERVRELRKEKKVPQKDLAERLGISVRAYHYYEEGKRYPDFQGLLTLADFYGVSVDYILGRTDNRKMNT